MVFTSNERETRKFAKILEFAVKKRGDTGIIETAASMMTAVCDAMAFGLGPAAARTLMHQAVDEFFDVNYKAN